MDARTDRDLWLSQDRDDAPAFGTLFDRHRAAVHLYCFRLTGSHVAAEDLLVETFLQAWRRRDEMTPVDDDALPVLLRLATACVPRGRRPIPTQRGPVEPDEVAMRDVLRRIAHVRGRHREILELDLPETRGLTVDRAAEVRERLMATMLAEPPRQDGPATSPMRPLVVGALLVFVLVAAGLAAAVAITVTAAQRGDGGSVVVDSDVLDVLYQGHRITQDDLVELTRVGKATFTTADLDTERDLHATRAFDTLHELDAYSADYLAWQKAKAAGEDVGAWGTVHP